MSETFDEIRRRARRYAEAMWGPAWDVNLSPAEASMRLAQAGRAMNEADAERAEVDKKLRSVESLARYWASGPCANRDTMTNIVAAHRIMQHLGIDPYS